MIIGDKIFDTDNNAYIMGILNVTPDSFSDGGKFNSYDNAMKRVEEMLEEGMDIVDVGGESTRPGYTLLSDEEEISRVAPISDEEEISRVAPIIDGIYNNFDVAIAVDTYKSAVAEASIQAGAHMINDIWGFKHDTNMADVVAKYNVSCCLMHNKNTTEYNDFIIDSIEEINECIELAIQAGVDKNKICIDPGIGFGKTYEHNLIMLKNLDKLLELQYPILLGTSRKSVIGMTLNVEPSKRMEATVATTVDGYTKGCRIFRVHDVGANKRALKMIEAISNA